MWVVTEYGFFTFVTDRKDPSYLWLRARIREDLERNFPGIEVTEHPGADYLFRAKVKRDDVAQRIAELVLESNITSHFKDEVNRRAAKPEFGSRSSAMYAFWNGMAACQPYAPYSKVPRIKTTTTWKNTPADRKPGAGQTSLPTYTYGGTGSGNYGSEFDWDSQAWGGGQGVSHPDPAVGATMPPQISEDEWQRMTSAERDAYLDAEEAYLRSVESDEDHGAAARAAEFLPGPEVADVLPAPRNRPGSRKARRKAKRANRHNQEQHSPYAMTDAEYARYAQERRDGKHGKRQQDRQTFIDNQRKQKETKS